MRNEQPAALLSIKGDDTYPSRKHTYPARDRAGMIVSTLIYADTYTL